jgi:hypothetical protein
LFTLITVVTLRKGGILVPRFNDNFYDSIIKITIQLNKHNIPYVEKQKGIIIVQGVKFYSFSEQWHDATNDTRGKGVKTFIDYIKNYKSKVK